MRFFSFLLIIYWCHMPIMYAQKPKQISAVAIYNNIKQLNFVGSALYIAAHPDDENTRLISYLSNAVHAKTAYLSLTRGDGGQNLIGTEIRELLGVLRTQELLAARRIDGGEQLFTRANDFGYSKHPKETLKIWNKDAVLADVVWAIRTFKPDVIINRFNHKTPGTTHGHHTASALLSVAAFDIAANKNKFKSQLKYTTTWQPKRLFFNTSWWFYGSKDKFNKATKNNSNLHAVNVGEFYPLQGVSNNEIAALASSQHLCQGFGRLSVRGSETEYLEFLKGDAPTDKTDLFSGINTTWSRLEGGKGIGAILHEVEANFNFKNPATHLPKLLQAYQKIKQLKDVHWRKLKTQQILPIIEACAGLYLEATTTESSAVPNAKVTINLELLNRNLAAVKFVSLRSNIDGLEKPKDLDLETNKLYNLKDTIRLKTANFTTPYWLEKTYTLGMYTVHNQLLIGKPETPKPTTITFNLLINNVPIAFTKTIVKRYAKKDKGELYEPFEILPKITTKLSDKVVVFASNLPKKVTVTVSAKADNTSGKLLLDVPENWQVVPKTQPFNIAKANTSKVVNFMVYPPKQQSEGVLKVRAISADKSYTKSLVTINYNHIPKQSVLLNSTAKVVRLNVKKVGANIGYIKGAGDLVPESLRQLGYNVALLDMASINNNSLSKFDAIVVGVRAYNVFKELQNKHKIILDYVAQGGNLVVQYNTNRGTTITTPYKLELGRGRVTNELSKVTILNKQHPLLNYPNSITIKDFEGWVQERGLYFPKIWAPNFTPLFAMNDADEAPQKGSLLVANYGKGRYIYTGLSFFRQLPAGVPGAYKLFANLLATKNDEKILVNK